MSDITPVSLPKFLPGKTGDGREVHVRANSISHLFINSKGEHVAYTTDPSAGTPIVITKEHWNSLLS